MRDCPVKQVVDVIVIQQIKDLPARFARPDDPLRAKQVQLVGGCRFAHPDDLA
jgi:hypothetical protein